MNDKELLELSAKAAGYEYRKSGGYIVVDGIPGNWNPLTNDGDALRLAVKLGYPHLIGTWIGCYTPAGEYEADPYAATRRAIVRAAAEIGKQT